MVSSILIITFFLFSVPLALRLFLFFRFQILLQLLWLVKSEPHLRLSCFEHCSLAWHNRQLAGINCFIFNHVVFLVTISLFGKHLLKLH